MVCFNCGFNTTEDQHCAGCNEDVCDECDPGTSGVWGSHFPEEHLEDPEEDDEC